MYIPITYLGTAGIQNLCVSASSSATEEGIFLSGSHVWQYFKFENTGSNYFTIESGSALEATVFLVGGGGGGGVTLPRTDGSGIGPWSAGGGGAGGVYYAQNYRLYPRTYEIIVGGGGEAGVDGDDTKMFPLYNSNSNPSEYFPTSSWLTAEGGGRGSYSQWYPDSYGRYVFNANGGGSGGGASRSLTLRNPPFGYTYETAGKGGGRVGQGSDGGNVYILPDGGSTTFRAGAGGGGAAETGSVAWFNTTATTVTRGGHGFIYNVDGNSTYYGGGGGGNIGNGVTGIWPSTVANGAGNPGAGGSGSYFGVAGGDPGVTYDGHDRKAGRDGIAVIMIPLCSSSLLECQTYELMGEGNITYLPCGSGSVSTLETFYVERDKKYKVCAYTVSGSDGVEYPLGDTCSQFFVSSSCSAAYVPIDITPPLPNNPHIFITPAYNGSFYSDYEGQRQGFFKIGNNNTSSVGFVVDYNEDLWDQAPYLSNETLCGQPMMGIDLDNTSSGSCATYKFSAASSGTHTIEYTFCGGYPRTGSQFETITTAFEKYITIDTTQPIITSSLVAACYWDTGFDQTTKTSVDKAYNVRVNIYADDWNSGNFSYINESGSLVSASISPGSSQDLVMQSIPLVPKPFPPTPSANTPDFTILSEYTGSVTPWEYKDELLSGSLTGSNSRIFKLRNALSTTYSSYFYYLDENKDLQAKLASSNGGVNYVSASVIPGIWATSGYVEDVTHLFKDSPHYAPHQTLAVSRSLLTLVDIGLTASYDGTGSTLYDVTAPREFDATNAYITNRSIYEYNTAVLDSGSMILRDSSGDGKFTFNTASVEWPTGVYTFDRFTLLVTWFGNNMEYSSDGVFPIFSSNPTAGSSERWGIYGGNDTKYDSGIVLYANNVTASVGNDTAQESGGPGFYRWHISQMSFDSVANNIKYNCDGYSGSVSATLSPTTYYFTPQWNDKFPSYIGGKLGDNSAVQVLAIYTGSLTFDEMEQNRLRLDPRY